MQRNRIRMIADWICCEAACFSVHQLFKNSGYSAVSVQWASLERDIKTKGDYLIDPCSNLRFLSGVHVRFKFSM